MCACLAAFEVHYNVNGGKNGDYFPLVDVPLLVRIS